MNNDVMADYDDSSFSPNWKKIAELNDNLRKTFSGGYVMTSNGIVALGPKRKWEIIKKVKEFNDFDFKNNPYGEHDFGAFTDGNEQIFWKIDYYDKSLEFASEDPSNPDVTNRVLTIYLAEEH